MTELPDPARFAHVTDWVFDLDNTLYPHHSNLFSQIDVKMTAYVSELLSLSREDVLAFYQGRVVKWWIPDDVVFVDEIPHTATGKMLKLKLREKFRDHRAAS